MSDCCSKKEVISGIKCEVKNCTYHTDSDHCKAGAIQVGYCNSCEKGETACTTFKAKQKSFFKKIPDFKNRVFFLLNLQIIQNKILDFILFANISEPNLCIL